MHKIKENSLQTTNNYKSKAYIFSCFKKLIEITNITPHFFLLIHKKNIHYFYET